MVAMLIDEGVARDDQDAENYLAGQDEAIAISRRAFIAYPDVFAGSSIDARERTVTVRFAHSDPSTLLQRALGDGPPSRFAVVAAGADYSLRELHSTMNDLAQNVRESSTNGTSGYGIRLDIIENRVVFLASPESQAQDSRQDERAQLGRRADQVQLSDEVMQPNRDDGCPSETRCDPPLRGGVEIEPVPSSGASGCTGGFVGRNQGGSWYLLTAGHCDPGGGGSYRQDTDTGPLNAFIGPVPVGGSVDTLDFDNARIFLDATSVAFWSPSRWVRHTATVAALAITGEIATPLTIPVGVFVCRAGMTSQTRCGDVVSIYSNPPQAGHQNFLEYDLCSAEGDSGGPVYTRTTNDGVLQGTAFALHSQSPQDGCAASEHSFGPHISAVQTSMSVEVWCGTQNATMGCAQR